VVVQPGGRRAACGLGLRSAGLGRVRSRSRVSGSKNIRVVLDADGDAAAAEYFRGQSPSTGEGARSGRRCGRSPARCCAGVLTDRRYGYVDGCGARQGGTSAGVDGPVARAVSVDGPSWGQAVVPDPGRSGHGRLSSPRVASQPRTNLRSGPLSVVSRLPEMVLRLWCGLNKPVFEAGVEDEGVRAG
jgi:hypothetical protein